MAAVRIATESGAGSVARKWHEFQPTLLEAAHVRRQFNARSSGAALARTTGISHRVLTDYLAGMEALQMIRRHHGRRELVAATNLIQLADRLGAPEHREARLTRYRKERAAWHAWLDRHLIPQLSEHELHDAEVDD